MIRIMGDRGVGKTTSLLFQANELARKHPTETIYFVCNHGVESIHRDKVPKNVKFITPMAFWHMNPTPDVIAVIDEVESFLGGLGVKAYSLTLSDRSMYNENN